MLFCVTRMTNMQSSNCFILKLISLVRKNSMISEYIEIIILSIIQGISEFLPVSSSAHVNLLSRIFGHDDIEIIINVSAHFGSLIAVILFFRKEKFIILYFYSIVFNHITSAR